MLRSLDIRDMLIIDRLELEFQAGLNVLTGETGAGKSILLDCLGFVLGWRGRAELVRQGAEHGEVSAEFSVPEGHPALAVLEEYGIPYDTEIVIRRINRPDGRKTAWVNDRRASGEVLRLLSAELVELHGQHDDRGLLNPAGHRVLLDEFASLSAQVAALRDIWRDLSRARKALYAAEAELEKAREEEEFLRHAVSELRALNPQPEEEAQLDAQRRLMQSAGRVREDIAKAGQALSYDGAEGMMADAMRWLDGVGDPAAELLIEATEALARAVEELGHAQQGVEQCLDNLNFDPMELERVEERLFAIRALARKHGVGPDDLAELSERFAKQLDAIEGGTGQIAALQGELSEKQALYDQRAHVLSRLRREAANRLEAAMSAELAPLKMERAVFAVTMAEADPGPDGIDAVSFTVATNPGAPSGPLNRIASGGELSRFLLALKVCLTAATAGITMIFDEIDRGVGGATADAVGRRLKSLADGSQVLVVTHSPQVAALAAHHWQVSKRLQAETTLSEVKPLDSEARVDEIARMLSGDTITPEARAAANALLQG